MKAETDSFHPAASDAGEDFRADRALSESRELLRIWQTNLGASREQCDEPGKVLWDRIERAVTAEPASRWPAPLAHKDDGQTPEMAWEFWKPLVCNEDGSLNEESVRNELSDFSMLMRYYSEILCAVTGHRISKQTTHPSAVVSVFEDWFSERVEEAVKEERESAAPSAEDLATTKRLVEEFYNGTAEKDWPAWGVEAVSLLERA